MSQTGDKAMNMFNELVPRLLRVSRWVTGRVRLDSLVVWILGFAIGALTNIVPVISFAIFLILTIVLAIILFIERMRAEQPSELNSFEIAVREPDNHAAAAVSRANEHFLVIGQVIEIVPHPNLGRRAPIEELGWGSSQIHLIDLQERFEANQLLSRTSGYKEFDPPNGTKFCLVSESFVTKDSPNLILNLRRTDYFTIKSVLAEIKDNPDLRKEFGALDPESNRIPHSLGLHYIVRFPNGDVLCMKRDWRAAYHGNRWSFSGEEQLSEEDFGARVPSEHFIRRTYCEEVLGMRDEIPIAERWMVAEDTVEAARFWSLILEEGISNYAIVGLYQLKVDIEAFITLHKKIVDTGMGTRDREGKFYIVSQPMLKALLFTGECTAKALFLEEGMETIYSYNLHPTSRYRIFRLLRAVLRRPLQPDLDLV